MALLQKHVLTRLSLFCPFISMASSLMIFLSPPSSGSLDYGSCRTSDRSHRIHVQIFHTNLCKGFLGFLRCAITSTHTLSGPFSKPQAHHCQRETCSAQLKPWRQCDIGKQFAPGMTIDNAKESMARQHNTNYYPLPSGPYLTRKK